MRRNHRWNEIRDMRKGASVVLVGGGTSLDGFDFDKIKHEFTIAINHTIEFFPDAKCLLFGDKVFLHKYDRDKFNFEEYKGLIFARETCKSSKPFQDWDIEEKDNLYFFEGLRDEPSMNPKNGLFHPTSSGFLAMNLALQMGARKIYLLGFDYYKNEEGRMHFFGDHEHHIKYDSERLERKLVKIKYFEKWSGKFVNCSPDSKIDLFEKKHWSEVWK